MGSQVNKCLSNLYQFGGQAITIVVWVGQKLSSLVKNCFIRERLCKFQYYGRNFGTIGSGNEDTNQAVQPQNMARGLGSRGMVDYQCSNIKH